MGGGLQKAPSLYDNIYVELLDIDLCASLFKLSLGLFGLVLGNAFLYVTGGTIDEIFGLFQTKTRLRTDRHSSSVGLGRVKARAHETVGLETQAVQ